MFDLIKAAVTGIYTRLDQISNSIDSVKQTKNESGGDDLVKILNSVQKLQIELKGLPGEDGKMPEKGVDYFTEKEIAELVDDINKKIKVPTVEEIAARVKLPDPIEGKTPERGVDYMTEKDVDMIVRKVAKAIKIPSLEGVITKKEIANMIAEAVSAKESELPEINPEVLARGLEALKGVDRLDYQALKNRPGVPTYDTGKRLMVRGGGSAMYSSDLSSQCDGIVKTFTVPVHKSGQCFLMGTQFPVIYRPTIDYTISGTTLTLTSEVGAPQAGQTLLFNYVP